MKAINVYDVEADTIEELSEKHDISEADVVEALLAALENGDIKLEDYI